MTMSEVEEARIDPVAFSNYVTGGALPVPDHHIPWYYSICLNDEDKFTNIIGPRGSAKTHVTEMAMSWHIGNYPHRTNMIISAGSEPAEQRIEKIRSILYSPRYQEVFPWIHVITKKIDRQKKLRVDSFSVYSERYIDAFGLIHDGLSYQDWRDIMAQFGDRDPTLFACGITARMLGKRISGLMVFDDIHDIQNSATEHQRLKIRNIVNGTVLGFRTATAKAVNICNRWAENDFGGYAKANPDTWKTYETFAIDDEGKSYWPSVWPIERLEQEEKNIGTSAFQSTYMNNPLGFASGLFKPEHLRTPFPDPLPTFDELYISSDLSYTEGKNDWTVSTAIGKYTPSTSGSFQIYILQMIRGRWSLKDSFQKIFQFADWIADTYGIMTSLLFEKQGLQSAVVSEKFTEQLENSGKLYPYTLVPLMGHKGDRAKFLAIKAQQHQLFINPVVIKDHPSIVPEFLGMKEDGNTLASNDDIMDACSLPGQLTHWYSGGSIYKTGVSTIKSSLLV